MEAEDVVHHRTPVMKERVTVMVPEMEVNMMVMPAVKEILSVAATIVKSLDCISTRRMTAVKDQTQIHVPHSVVIIPKLSVYFPLFMEVKPTPTVLGMPHNINITR